MERKEFLSLLGLSTSSMVLACLGACTKQQGTSTVAPTGIDFILDLTQPSYVKLQTNGSFVYNNGVIVAKTINGQYIAVQQICTHEQFSVVYEPTIDGFYCSGHGGTFLDSGQVTGGPPPRPLQKYNTTLTGNMLRVYS